MLDDLTEQATPRRGERPGANGAFWPGTRSPTGEVVNEGGVGSQTCENSEIVWKRESGANFLLCRACNEPKTRKTAIEFINAAQVAS